MDLGLRIGIIPAVRFRWRAEHVILPSASWAAERDPSEERPFEQAFKRLLDIIAASAGLLLLLPVFVVISAAVALDSPGPVFYTQLRVGINRRRGRSNGLAPDVDRRRADTFGRPFQIYKFRSMIMDAERGTGPVWASAKDSRVTRIGKFIRRTRIDEIPQFWNVLVGDMSLVGPRPERPTMVQSLAVSIPDYPKRYRALPGITGLAQVKSNYDTSIDSVRRKLQYDLYYLKNGRTMLDLKIIAATVKVVVRGGGY